MYGKISVAKISGTVERHNSARNKKSSPSDSLYDNELQCKLNGGNEFCNKKDKEVIF